MKKILSILLILILIISTNITCFASNITIERGKHILELNNSNSRTINNRLFVSLDELINFIDNDITKVINKNEIKLYKVETNATQKTNNSLTKNLNGRFEVKMNLNSKSIILNTAYNLNPFGYYSNISSIQTTMDSAPVKIDNKIFVPIRYVLYSLGYTLEGNKNFTCKYIGIQDSTFGIN